MISQEAIQKILGIESKVSLSADEMVKEMAVTFFPEKGTGIDENVIAFSKKLENSFKNLNIIIIPYESALEKVRLRRRISRIFRIIINNVICFYSHI